VLDGWALADFIVPLERGPTPISRRWKESL
jgi:hypothetical protein